MNSTGKVSHWNAVWSMTIGVSALIIAEFLPAGLLTPIASDLSITEGVAGQAVTVTSVFAVLTSLTIAFVTSKYNRKPVLLVLSGLLTLSSLIVAISPNFIFLLFGRVLLGVALGGFWSMATSTSIRLVRDDDVPKALSIMFGGSSFSAVLAAPLGSFLGHHIGWRNVFLIAAGVGLLAFTWQACALPRLESSGKTKLGTILEVLKVDRLILGLLAISLVFCGRFASFTYLRPFLEQTTKLAENLVSVGLMLFGLSYFIGNWFTPGLVRRGFRLTLGVPPALLSIVAIGLLSFGSHWLAAFVLIFCWGALFGPVAPGWSTWVARKVPDQTETGGGLYVAATQLAAAVGAFVGGFVFDTSGSAEVFILSGLSWALSALIVYFFIFDPKSTKEISGSEVAIVGE